MEERFYREQEIARLPAFLPAATYNLAHTLLARAGKCLFVPIRSLQYMAVLDAEEFIFVDSQNKAWVELAWQHFRPQARSALDERVPFEVVHYAPQAAETMKRLPGEFHQGAPGARRARPAAAGCARAAAGAPVPARNEGRARQGTNAPSRADWTSTRAAVLKGPHALSTSP